MAKRQSGDILFQLSAHFLDLAVNEMEVTQELVLPYLKM